MQPAFQEHEFSDSELADMAEELAESKKIGVFEAIIAVVEKNLYLSFSARAQRIEAVNAVVLRRGFERLRLASLEEADKRHARCDEREERISH